MSIRNHHYIFAHVALPQLFLSDPERFLGALHEDGEVFLEHLWKMVGKKMPSDEVLSSEGLDFGFEIDSDALLAIVQLPPARAAAEALLVGCHCWKTPPSNLATTPRARYFTLELGGQEIGQGRTVLCEWQQENGQQNHVNYGTGPNTAEDFIAAIQHKVLPSSRRS